MKTKNTTIVILFCSFWISHTSIAQESKFKALFIYKFAEYIEWPSSRNKFVVGVVGETDVFDELSKFTKTNSDLEVIKLKSSKESTKCNIVFLPKSVTKDLKEYAASISESSVLMVGENKESLDKGADIGFFIENRKLRFAIDKASIEKKHMIPSSKLLALGQVI